MVQGKTRQLDELRINDRILMEDVGTSPYLSETDKVEVNYCRLFLQVETLSEICTVEGKTLATQCMDQTDRTCPSTSNSLWPKQGLPGKKQWKTFDNFIRKTYCRTQDSDTLRKALGKWYPHKFLRRNWSTYYNAEHKVLTVYEEDQLFHMYKVQPLRAAGGGGIVDTEEIATGPTYSDKDGLPAEVEEETNRCSIP